MEYFVYLTYPVMLGILIWGMKVYKKGEWNEDVLSLKQTKYFQGYITLGIMLHHIGQETCASWQQYKLYPGLEFFVPIGYILVAVFMFCSGYGLYTSYVQKEEYLGKGFFKKRVLPIVIGFYVSGMVYFLARIIMGEKMTPWKIFCYITGIGMPNQYSWFAIVMPLFYLFFYLSFKFCGRFKIPMVIVLITIYTFIGTCIDHNDYLMRGEWWYNCVHLFWIGILVGKYKEQVLKNLKKGYLIKLIVFVILFAVFWRLTYIAKDKYSYYGQNMGLPHTKVVLNRWICLLTEIGSSTLFVLITFMLGMKVKIGNKFLKFMGGITLEFYLMHGLILEFFSYRFCDIVKSIYRITNVALLVLVVFVASVPLALALKKICHIGNQNSTQGF